MLWNNKISSETVAGNNELDSHYELRSNRAKSNLTNDRVVQPYQAQHQRALISEYTSSTLFATYVMCILMDGYIMRARRLLRHG